MNARALAAKLLEAGPDELDPRSELLRNDPAQDIKEIVQSLQIEGVEVIGYNRIGVLVKMFIRIKEWATEESIERWLEHFLREAGVDPGEGAITARNLGFEGAGRCYKIFFPMEGPSVPYKELIKI